MGALPGTTGRRRIYLMRHGFVDYTSPEVRAAQDPSIAYLTEQGREEARAAGIALSDVSLDVAFHIGLRRTQETAEIVLGQHDLTPPELEQESRFQELRSGQYIDFKSAEHLAATMTFQFEQAGKPVELYEDPDNLFVAGFIGSPRMNFFDATVVAVEGNKATVSIPRLDGVKVPLTLADTPAQGASLKVGIRPEHFEPEGPIRTSVEVEVVENLGGVSYAYSTAADGEDPITIEWRGRARPGEGGAFEVGFDPGVMLAFDAESGHRIR